MDSAPQSMPDKQSVTGWLQGLQAGDQEAADALWRRYFEKLVHLDVKCVRQSVPHDLIDADHPAVIVTLVFFAIADAFVTIGLSAVEAD